MIPAHALRWVMGYTSRANGDVPGTYTATYRLSDLVKRGFLSPNEGSGLLMDAGLIDLVWQLQWSDRSDTPDEALTESLDEAHGYAIFLHGWTGNHRIWESIPGLLVTSNPRLIAIAVDHNGFGDSRFVDNTPAIERCGPPATMQVIERLIDMLKIRRQSGGNAPKVINTIGHSMGGAALFYSDASRWRYAELTRLALAPALLLEDELNRAFFTALGIGIGIVNRLNVFELIERAIKPGIIDTVCSGASQFVRQMHRYVYESTPRGTTAATFMAMGLLKRRDFSHQWDLFRVTLAHRDALVGLVPMMDMLSTFEFPTSQTRVVAGSHYLFSVGPEAVYQHAQNRQLVVNDILDLHERAYAMQRTGHLIG